VRAVLALLIRLLPAPFRRQFGADILEQIRRDHERAAERGLRAVVRFAALTAADLLRSAAAERLAPTWVAEREFSARSGRHWTMDGWTRDLRHALRSLRRAPGFTAVTVVTLGLAIGANAGIFSVVDTVLLDPLPFGNADRLVYIGASAPGSDMPDEFGVSVEFVVQYRERSQLLEEVSTYNSFTATLRAGDRVERIRMSMPTTSMFSTLDVTPVLGRLPTAADEDRVAVISHALWVTWFGSDPDVLGRTYEMAGAPRTVIGVMGPEFRFPDDGTLLWIPVVIRPVDIVPGRFGLPVVGRMAPGVTPAQVAAELGRLARQLPERFGGSADYARLIERHRAVVRPLEAQLMGSVSGSLWVLLGSVGIVLLIACANVANLFMVRAERKQRDLAIRRAIGAGRAHLLRSQMSETLIMAVLAGGLALVLAWITVPLFVRLAPAGILRLHDAHLNLPTLGFTAGITVLSAFLCGLVPAIRSSAPNLGRLRDGSRGSTSRRSWGRDGLVVAQTALALVLLIGSGLLIRSFEALRDVDPGYDTKDIFTFQFAPEQASLTDGPSWARFHHAFMDRLAALPGVESVGIVENVPLDEGVSDMRVRREDRPAGDGAGTLLSYTFTSGDYFGTMGISLLAGRPFTQADDLTNHGNIIISRSAADLLWPGENAVGRRVQREGAETWETVVGVVEDVMQYGFRDTPQAMIYFPLVGQTPESWWLSSPAYVVKTPRASSIAPEIRALVHEVTPEAPMYRVYTMEGLARNSMMQLSFTMLTLGMASMLALLLGMIGLYGVLSYIVAERTREIGVRMALGAQVGQVRRMVVTQGARVVTIGVVLGVVVAWATTRVLGGLLYGVGAVDAATFGAMSATMLSVGLLASYVPARRASGVDPIRTLRGD